MLPRGAGKTLVALIAVELLQAGTCVVAPTWALVAQWCTQLADAFGAEWVGAYYYGDEKEVRSLTVTTYHSAFALVERWGDRFPRELRSPLMNVVEAYIELTPDLIADDGTVTDATTESSSGPTCRSSTGSSRGSTRCCPAQERDRPTAAPAVAYLLVPAAPRVNGVRTLLHVIVDRENQPRNRFRAIRGEEQCQRGKAPNRLHSMRGGSASIGHFGRKRNGRRGQPIAGASCGWSAECIMLSRRPLTATMGMTTTVLVSLEGSDKDERGLPPAANGSVTEKLLRESDVPVLLVTSRDR